MPWTGRRIAGGRSTTCREGQAFSIGTEDAGDRSSAGQGADQGEGQAVREEEVGPDSADFGGVDLLQAVLDLPQAHVTAITKELLAKPVHLVIAAVHLTFVVGFDG